MKAAIYPGSFDPLTKGHLDIINRSSLIFDKLIIAIADDNNKKAMFSIEERLQMIHEEISDFKNIEVQSFSGLLMNFAELKKINVIIRGLRVLSDFEFEFKMAMMNRGLNNDVDTLFLMPNERYIHICSSLIKEIASLGGDISNYVSPNILNKIKDKDPFEK